MKNTFRLATSAMMRPLGEMLFSNGRDQGMAAGANMVRSLAAADFDQARAQGQQRRNYMQSEQGLGDFFRVAGGDFSGYNTEGLDEVGQQKAKDSLTATLQALILPGDTNYQQLAKGRQDMAVHDAAVYGKNPVAAATLAATFNNGKLWDNAGNGQTFNVATGGMRDSGLTQAIMREKQAHAGLYYAQTQGELMDNQEVPLGNALGGMGGLATPYDQAIMELSNKYGIDPKITKGIITIESGWNPGARSGVGAGGLMQVMPENIPNIERALGRRLNMTDPRDQIEAGLYVLNEHRRINKGDLNKAIHTYHGGFDPRKWGPKSRAYLGWVQQAAETGIDPRNGANPAQRRFGSGGVRRKYAEPLIAKQMTGDDKVTPLAGSLGDAFQIPLTGPDGKPVLDVNEKPIMSNDNESRQRFYRWMSASGNRDMNAALIQWEAQGRPDAGSTSASEIPADSLAGQLASALMPGFLGGSTRPPSPQASARASSQKVDGRITSKAIMEQAQMSHANPGMVVAQLRKNGIDVPQSVLVELKQQGFSVN